MAFTHDQAKDLLEHARQAGRMPHALLLCGSPESGTHRLALHLASTLNGARADSIESLRHPMCRVLRPSSKSRRILIEEVRGVEPFLALRAAEGETKLIIILEADRMGDEAANAFLKTLEEPPPQTLIVLVTALPSRLLSTIRSRCVRMDLREPSTAVRLSDVQQHFLPALRRALPHIGSDITALALRADIQELMAKRRELITNRLTEAMKADFKALGDNPDLKAWEAQQKDATTALIETEYLAERAQVLELLSLCLGQAVLIASHAPDTIPITPEIPTVAQQHPIPDLLRRMSAVDALRADLQFNINEPLALESRLLDIIGKSPL